MAGPVGLHCWSGTVGRGSGLLGAAAFTFSFACSATAFGITGSRGGGSFGASALGLLCGAGFLLLAEEATGFNRIGQG